jgi:hypothetical protein
MGKNPGVVFLLGTAAAAWLIYDTATTVEGPSQTLALMKYFLIAVVAIVTLYSGAKWFISPPPAKPRDRPASDRGRKAQDRSVTSSG